MSTYIESTTQFHRIRKCTSIFSFMNSNSSLNAILGDTCNYFWKAYTIYVLEWAVPFFENLFHCISLGVGNISLYLAVDIPINSMKEWFVGFIVVIGIIYWFITLIALVYIIWNFFCADNGKKKKFL